jgi:hypothetical protein
MGRKLSEETKQKIRETKARNPRPAWNKGRAATEEQKQKQSLTMRRKYESGEITHWNSGKNTPPEIRKKISDSCSGKVLTEEQKQKHIRELEIWRNSPGWRPPMLGKTLSAESKAKISESSKINARRQTDKFIDRVAAHLASFNISLIDKTPTGFQLRCKNCGLEFHRTNSVFAPCKYKTYDNEYCPACFPRMSGHSLLEKELVDFIKSVENGVILENSRNFIAPLELDIVIPDKNLAFEFDGIYWHSELAGKDPQYHVKKTKLCRENGIRLVHIFENEWTTKQDIVKSRISNMLGLSRRIAARRCKVVYLDAQAKSAFIKQNHIQGDARSSINIGLVYEGEIIAAMTFGKPRFAKKFEWELIRYSNALGITVTGGASRLFAEFIRRHSPTTVVSYSDRRWNTGRLYERLGFHFSHSSDPNYFYFKNPDKLWSRNRFQKHKLQKLLESFDPELTEWENMQANGWNRIWDCGNDVWVWRKDAAD